MLAPIPPPNPRARPLANQPAPGGKRALTRDFGAQLRSPAAKPTARIHTNAVTGDSSEGDQPLVRNEAATDAAASTATAMEPGRPNGHIARRAALGMARYTAASTTASPLTRPTARPARPPPRLLPAAPVSHISAT